MFEFDDKMSRVLKEGSDEEESVARAVITECMTWLFQSRISGANHDANAVAEKMIDSMRNQCKNHSVNHKEFIRTHSKKITEHLKWISEKGWSKYVLASMASANKVKRRIMSIKEVFGDSEKPSGDLKNDEIDAINMHGGMVLTPRKFYEA